jgi:hypothetical protein
MAKPVARIGGQLEFPANEESALRDTAAARGQARDADIDDPRAEVAVSFRNPTAV